MPKLRKILPWILSFLTGKPRYLPDIEWSQKSWVHNIFRVYELIFWRKYGIRKEASAYLGKDGNVHYQFYTLESFLLYSESLVRELFKKKFKLNFEFTQLQFAMPVNTPQLQIPWISFAIAFGGNSTGNATAATNTISYSFTTGGSDRIMFSHNTNDTSAQDNTVATYNSVSMTNIQSANFGGVGSWIFLWMLVAPTTGSNTYSSSFTSNHQIDSLSIYYTGAKQTAQPDNSTSGFLGAANSFALTLTTVADNSWAMMSTLANTGTLSGGAATTLRAFYANTANTALTDTNAAVTPAGSVTLTTANSTLAIYAGCMASFAPVPTSQIKSVSAVAQASIKLVNDTTLANIKSVSGVPNS